MSVEPYGVLVTNGDNDTFPLWYLQEVEGVRQDVTVMVRDYLNMPWYVRQMRRLTEPCPPGVDPAAHPTRVICQRPFDPSEIPAALAAAGWTEGVQPPRDSILPLSDGEIEEIAGSWLVTREPMALRAGAIRTRIEAGTPLLPADSFVAAMLQATLGERPVYFMPLSPAVTRLGLWGHTVRQGVAWRIWNGPLPAPGGGVTRLPEGALSSAAGAAVDLPLTDTLLWEVYLRRGRILDPDAPWPDPATTNIVGQYAHAHYVAAQAHALRGEAAATERNLRRAEWWQEVAVN
jgi:hypothetical protein